jgi:hypothetical protein
LSSHLADGCVCLESRLSGSDNRGVILPDAQPASASYFALYIYSQHCPIKGPAKKDRGSRPGPSVARIMTLCPIFDSQLALRNNEINKGISSIWRTALTAHMLRTKRASPSPFLLSGPRFSLLIALDLPTASMELDCVCSRSYN